MKAGLPDWPQEIVAALIYRLTRFARRLVAQHPVIEVDDLVQETFARIMIYGPEKDKSLLWSIAARTMKNLWLDSLKVPRSFVSIDDDGAFAIERYIQPPCQEDRVYVSQLVRAFDKLTPDRRRVAYLLLDGEDRDEIKISLGRGSHAVNTLLGNLRNDLKAQGFADEGADNAIRGVEKIRRQWRIRIKDNAGRVLETRTFKTFGEAAKAKRRLDLERRARKNDDRTDRSHAPLSPDTN